MKTSNIDVALKNLNLDKNEVICNGVKLKRVIWKGCYGSVHITWEIVK